MKHFSLSAALVALAMSAHANAAFMPDHGHPRHSRSHTSDGHLRRALMTMPSYPTRALRNMARRVRQGRTSKHQLRAALVAHAVAVRES